uniref:Uncharacterized protein n=1 Tax=Dendroctonus ponderosae TaxID=77166 RepID=A0AAR5Q5U4_DENPD
MTTTGKLSNFRQLSLICDSPSPHAKRQSLKKQFSEDFSDFKDPWFDQGPEVYLNARNKRLERTATDKPPPIKIAWCEKTDKFALNEEVIIKKCKEVKRAPSVKLARHPSLEKDSILNSKHDLRNKAETVDKENDKAETKPNLQIFLAHNTHDYNECQTSDSFESLMDSRQQCLERSKPKYLQPLLSNVEPSKAFQIRKSNSRKTLESPKAVEVSQKRPNFSRSNTIVVVPLVEKLDQSDTPRQVVKDEETKPEKDEDSNGINVIIRPMTAQTRREKFQKRTNSAFHGTSKETAINFRPPLVRSSSAPSIKPEKGKFLATKRKLKNGKKVSRSSKGDHSPHAVDGQEWKNAAHTASEIVTMVSLISPSGSENEADSEDELKARPKSALKREDSAVEKTTTVGKEAANKDGTKNVSLRKTVKSVSFQQSSIHAVRSFSASFPARRSSMATALSLGNHANPSKLKANSAKTQEKRSTNPDSPDADERVPKRRLLRNNTVEKKNSSSWQKAASHLGQIIKTEDIEEVNSTFTIDIQTKTSETDEESTTNLGLEPNVILITPPEKKCSLSVEETAPKTESTCETPKEKQCWEMYCKMSEKGINVSYDTILRGLLTPTEYRIRRSASIAEEMEMLMNPPSEEDKV